MSITTKLIDTRIEVYREIQELIATQSVGSLESLSAHLNNQVIDFHGRRSELELIELPELARKQA